MKFLKLTLATVICLAVIFSACKKEDVFTERQSYGSLTDSSGECLPKIVEGIYNGGQTLVAEHYIDIHVIVDSVGDYEIKTDSLNGYYFKGTGTFGIKGDNKVRLYGHGKPLSGGIDIFTVRYGSTACTVAVKVIGAPRSIFAIDTTGGCPGVTLEGTFSTNIPATSANKAKLKALVTTTGAYDVSIPAQNGVSFRATGFFAATGLQTIEFIASGTPTVAGDFNYTATVNGTSCTYSVHVVEGPTAAVFTLGGSPSACTGFLLDGIYKAGTALSSSNTVKLAVTVTTIGAYSITTNTVNGISFSGSGTFASTGAQTVTLTGMGTPSAAATNSYTVTAGASTCTFSVTAAPGSVTPPPTGDCKACVYVPWCTGTTYTNINTSTGSAPQTLNAAITVVKDTTIDGMVFTKTTTGSGPGFPPIYYNCTGGVTTIVTLNVTSVSGTTTVTKLVQTLLKANEPVGASWINTLPMASPDPSITSTGIYEWSIGEKGISRTVQGVTYTDVIRVHLVLSTKLSMDGIPDQTIVGSESDYYYARGVGVIEVITKNALGQVALHQELKSYFIP